MWFPLVLLAVLVGSDVATDAPALSVTRNGTLAGFGDRSVRFPETNIGRDYVLQFVDGVTESWPKSRTVRDTMGHHVVKRQDGTRFELILDAWPIDPSNHRAFNLSTRSWIPLVPARKGRGDDARKLQWMVFAPLCPEVGVACVYYGHPSDVAGRHLAGAKDADDLALWVSPQGRCPTCVARDETKKFRRWLGADVLAVLRAADHVEPFAIWPWPTGRAPKGKSPPPSTAPPGAPVTMGRYPVYAAGPVQSAAFARRLVRLILDERSYTPDGFPFGRAVLKGCVFAPGVAFRVWPRKGRSMSSSAFSVTRSWWERSSPEKPSTILETSIPPERISSRSPKWRCSTWRPCAP